MHLIFYPQQDASIYEDKPYANAGLEPYIEIHKTRVSTVVDTGSLYKAFQNYNSRGVIKFDLSDILVKQNQGIIPTTSSRSFTLKLYTRALEHIEGPFDIEVAQLSLSGSTGLPTTIWKEGIGYLETYPTSSQGITWKTKGTPTHPENLWFTGSYTSDITGSWSTVPGGGTWLSSSVVSQSFDGTTDHLQVDVSQMIETWLSGSVQNQGFLIKRSVTDELSSESLSRITFYSKDTSTVYAPTLRVSWDDSVYTTGSVPLYSMSAQVPILPVVWIKGMKPEYYSAEYASFNIGVREQFPTRTFTTNSLYNQQWRLSSGSEYSIIDPLSGRSIIPFGSHSRISHTPEYGSFFNVYMNCLQENCYYDIYLKTAIEPNSTQQERLFGPFRFKVINP